MLLSRLQLFVSLSRVFWNGIRGRVFCPRRVTLCVGLCGEPAPWGNRGGPHLVRGGGGVRGQGPSLLPAHRCGPAVCRYAHVCQCLPEPIRCEADVIFCPASRMTVPDRARRFLACCLLSLSSCCRYGDSASGSAPRPAPAPAPAYGTWLVVLLFGLGGVVPSCMCMCMCIAFAFFLIWLSRVFVAAFGTSSVGFTPHMHE